MREYDRLPADLRQWLSKAKLPWRPKSVQRAFDKALARTKDSATALRELDSLEDRLMALDGPKVWGAAYPAWPEAQPQTK